MRDRQPTLPKRALVTPWVGKGNTPEEIAAIEAANIAAMKAGNPFHARVEMDDEPYEGFEGTEWNKANVLTDETAAAIGEGVVTPNDAFRALSNRGAGHPLLINRFLQVWQRGTTITNPVNTYIADRLKLDGNGTFRARLGTDNKPIGGAIITGNIDCRYLMEHIDFEWLGGREFTFSYSVDGHVTSNTFIANVGNCPFDGDGRRIAAFSPGAGTLEWFNLDIGDRVTPPVPRLIVEELALCQRYYEKSYNLEIAPGTITTTGMHMQPTVSATADLLYPTPRYRVIKRTNATMTLYRATDGLVGLRNYTTGANLTISTVHHGQSTFQPSGFGATGINIGDLIGFQWTADAEL